MSEPSAILYPPSALRVEPREFHFHWLEDGARKTITISAESYPDACWELGVIHAARFVRGNRPVEFEMDLVSQAPR
jgi:hypothetical protein